MTDSTKRDEGYAPPELFRLGDVEKLTEQKGARGGDAQGGSF